MVEKYRGLVLDCFLRRIRVTEFSNSNFTISKTQTDERFPSRFEEFVSLCANESNGLLSLEEAAELVSAAYRQSRKRRNPLIDDFSRTDTRLSGLLCIKYSSIE